jgi:hypothetical protein
LVAYTEVGHDTEARTEAAEVMRISPHFTLASIGKVSSLHPRWIIDDRKAGLK